MKIIVAFFGIICFLHSQQLDKRQAEQLSKLPLKCMQQEYPNKLSNVLATEEDLGAPKTLHPAFYGCFDWHSSVHGHWSLAYIANHFPELAESIITELEKNITQENIQKEVAYFQKKHEYSYERTYGWNWLMKLQLELEQSKEPRLNQLAKNLEPLTHLIEERYLNFLPKLTFPLRVGTHSNTAFGLSFAYDYAVYKNKTDLKNVIEKTANRLFYTDRKYPLQWEPSGTDFLSPSMEEVDIMRRILSEKDFLNWAKKFLPELFNRHWTWAPAEVSDRTDGHLVHLDGLNFSRAWVLYSLANQFPKQMGHLTKVADKHLNFSLPQLVDGNYEGEHWLASFALYALQQKSN